MKNIRRLSENELMIVVGGYTAKHCLKAIGIWGIGGLGTGAVGGGPAGAFLGAHVGVIAGSAVCIGGFLGS